MDRGVIEQVHIAGQIGKAIYRLNDSYFVLGVEESQGPVECFPRDLTYLFDSGAEFVEIPGKGLDVPKIRNLLQDRQKAHQALSMVLGGLDSELSKETRFLCIEAAEELLQEGEGNLAFVQTRVLARPLPSTADMRRAIEYAENLHAGTVTTLYKDIRESQWAISILLEAWKDASQKFFPSSDEQTEGENLLIDIGLFADMVTALRKDDLKALGTKILRYSLKPEITKRLKQFTVVVNDLRVQLIKIADLVATNPQIQIQEESDWFDDDATETIEPTGDTIDSLISEFNQRSRNWKPARAHEANEKINNQIAAITRYIQQGNLNNAREFLFDLIQFHLRFSAKEHTAMSLCSLAKIAIDSSHLAFANELIEYALSLNIDDAVIDRTQAEIFKAQGFLDSALAAYEANIARFPNDVVAHNGYAEVLKEVSRFDEALNVYQETLARFPDNVVAHNGYAEMLKEVSRFDEALTIYQETIARFPNDVFARNGYAEVLKEVSRFDEALTVYQETLARFPDNVVARSGYAEVLKEVSRFDEALNVYQETIARFPSDVVARSGYAEVLKEVSRFDEALTVYQETLARFPNDQVSKNGFAALLLTIRRFDAVQSLLSTNALISKQDWIAYHILAMSYLRQGNVAEAVARLEYGLNNVKWKDLKGYFVNALALAKLTEKKFSEVEQIFTDNVIRSNRFQQQSQSIIIGHSQAALGKKVEAIHTLDNIPAAQSSNIIRIKDFLARRYSLKQYSQTEVSPSEIASLDREIEELEFSLVLRAA